jgi:putative membrane protein
MLWGMLGLLVRWLVNAIALVVAAYVIPEFEVDSFGVALWAALVVGILNVTLGWLLGLVTWPLGVLLPTLVYLLIEMVMLYLAAKLVSGFRVKTWMAAFLGACVFVLIRLVFGLAQH